MTSFARTLERLHKELHEPAPGRNPDIRVVRAKDLDELLYHFSRLDGEARQRHYDEQEARNSGRPSITFEKITRGDDTFHRAHVVGKGFDHHGEAPALDRALLFAVEHWVATNNGGPVDEHESGHKVPQMGATDQPTSPTATNTAPGGEGPKSRQSG